MSNSKMDKSHRKNVYTEGNTTYLPMSITVNAPAAVVWKVFGENFGTFLAKVPGLFTKVSCDIPVDRSPEVGDSRFYTFYGLRGQEKLKVFDEKNFTLSYDIPVGPPKAMIRNGGNTWSVRPADDDESKSIFEMKLQGDYTSLGRLLAPLIRSVTQWPVVEAFCYTVKEESEQLYNDMIAR